MISESRAEEQGISCVKTAALGPVLWALVDFQLTPVTRNNLPVAVFVCLFVVVFLFVVVLVFGVFWGVGGGGAPRVYK